MMISKLAAQFCDVFKMSSGIRSAVHCAVIGGAVLMAFAPAAHAVVVVSSVSNVTVPANTDGIYINVVTGATGFTGATTIGWDISPYGSSALAFYNPTTPSGSVYTTNGATTPANLPTGFVIGATSTYGSGVASFLTGWQLNRTNYFGFRFLNEADGLVHYGYGTMIVGAAVTDRKIGSLFYESVAGNSITVAPVPEPASAALMLLGGAGIASLVARRRRRSA